MTITNGVFFTEMNGAKGDIGVITLNRPEKLNALNEAMAKAMLVKLETWAEAKNIQAVVIRPAPGRAFCAGGDLRLLYDEFQQTGQPPTSFFHTEYLLNAAIYNFPKPYIALMDGITMGGGAGLSVHGSLRIVTERTVFAMPETGIGFFPDVGGTYFLPRLPGALGQYLGLTGVKLNADECVGIGIADYKIQSNQLEEFLQALVKLEFTQDVQQKVNVLAEKYAEKTGPSALLEQQMELDKYFTAASVEKIFEKLETDNNEQLAAELLSTLQKKSPTSLKVTHRAIEVGKTMQFEDCMQQEYRLAVHFLNGHDFMEGIRALIVEKDQAPKWLPNSLEGVTGFLLDTYFAPLQTLKA